MLHPMILTREVTYWTTPCIITISIISVRHNHYIWVSSSTWLWSASGSRRTAFQRKPNSDDAALVENVKKTLLCKNWICFVLLSLYSVSKLIGACLWWWKSRNCWSTSLWWQLAPCNPCWSSWLAPPVPGSDPHFCSQILIILPWSLLSCLLVIQVRISEFMWQAYHRQQVAQWILQALTHSCDPGCVDVGRLHEYGLFLMMKAW